MEPISPTKVSEAPAVASPGFDGAVQASIEKLPNLESLRGQLPVLLLPVRVQIKFMRNSEEDLKRFAETSKINRFPLELLVRLYPDQLSIERHEEGLTESESLAGRQYWQQALTSFDREPQSLHSLLAWQMLLGRFPANRAYFIILSTLPNDVEALREQSNAIRERLEQPAGSSEQGQQQWPEEFLRRLEESFPAVNISPSAWTKAAMAKCLPDRFVVALYNKKPLVGDVTDPYIKELFIDNNPTHYNETDYNVTGNDGNSHAPGETWREGTLLDQTSYAKDVTDLTTEFLDLVRVAQGAPIKGNELPVGLNGSDPASSGLDEKQGLAGDLAWLADFGKAVEAGMGLVIPFEDDDQFDRGFDRLVVTGIRTSRDAGEEAAQVSALLQGHAFTDGLALVPQGTPTNNTSGEGAGFSSDDQYNAEATFKTFLQGPPFDKQPTDLPWEQLQDGQRLAEVLGVKPEVFAHSPNADRTDGQEASVLNRVLWPATFGYFLREMLEPTLISPKVSRLVRRFFETYVTGRGPAPAFRVGSVPYGVLPTTWYSQWKPEELEGVGALSWDVLRRLDATWTERLNAFAKYPPVFSSKETPFFSAPPSRQDILTVLGNEAASVEFYQRYFVGPNLMDTMAHRVAELEKQGATVPPVWPPVPVFDLGGIHTRTGKNPRPTVPGRYFGNWQNPLYRNFLNFFNPKSANNSYPKKWSYAFDTTYQVGYRKVVHTYADEPKPEPEVVGPIVDALPISETRRIKPLLPTQPDAVTRPGETPSQRNYIHWLVDSTFDEIRVQDFRNEFPKPEEPAPDGFEVPKSLLYYLLRQAVMWRYWEAAEAILNQSQNVVPRQEVELFNILSKDVARWEWLYRKADDGSPLHLWLRKADHPEAEGLRNYLKELRSLADLPTARLERLLAEHLDLGNHRLDAWKTGHVLARLLAQRQQEPQGMYVGAFGWLEDVYHQDKSKSGGDNLRNDPDNLGYIHAPTINHGVAAAVLRQGYKSRQFDIDDDHPEANRMAVNLSSERVRRALALLEGVRTGSSLAALLGRDFEEGLFNATPPNEPSYALQIERFRIKYPYADEKAVPGQPNARQQAPEQDRKQLVNGLALLKDATAFRTPLPAYPDAVLGITIQDASQRARFWEAVQSEINELQNTLDALGDLTVGETVYQAVIGNVEQAAALLENVAKGKFPASPEVVHPSRAGVSLTHRVLLHLPQVAPTHFGSWPTTLSPLAAAEPALNRWLASFFGDPTQLVIPFTYAAPASTPDNPLVVQASRHLGELGLHPLDVWHLLNPEALQPGSAFEVAVAKAVREEVSLPNRASDPDKVGLVTIDYSQLSALAGLLPLLQRLRQLLAASRPANANDLRGPSQLAPGQVHDTTGGVDQGPDASAYAATRLETARAAMQAIAAELEAALPSTSPPTAAEQAALRTLLFRNILYRAAAYNLPEAYLAAAAGAEDPAGAAKTVLLTLKRRLAGYDQVLRTEPDAARKWAAAGKALLGEDFRLSIPCQLPLEVKAAYTEAFNANTSLLRHHTNNPDLLAEWLQGLAPVRDAMNHLEKVVLLNDLLWDGAPGHVLPGLTPTQLSTRTPTANEYWLGAEYPSETKGYTPPQDAVSLVQLLADGTAYQAAGVQQALWLDEWVETIPNQKEDTSLVFHYDQPNMEAPQTLLLAVSPNQEPKSWDWPALLGTVSETLDFAKKRAVEPANLAFTHLGVLLPAIVAPVAHEEVTMPLDLRQLINRPQFVAKQFRPD